LVKDIGLDGLDVDWEYPADEAQANDYVALLRTTREALQAYSNSLPGSPHFELTIACPAGAWAYRRLKLHEMDQYLDFWNLMAYDFSGSWGEKAAHQANISPSQHAPETTPYSADAAIEHYVQQGISPDKIVLGMPLYGRAFAGTDGPGHGYSGTGEGSWEAGVWDYKALPRPGSVIEHDTQAIASWTYNPHTKTMITYDTPQTAAAKVEYIKHRGLGGAMWWESSGDKMGEESLINLVVQGLGGFEGRHMQRRDNLLEYPHSKYENLRKGMPGE